MTRYITADLHHGHDKVIERCGRPTTPEEHENWLIKQINSVVRTHDTVYNLGDFTFYKNEEVIRKFCNRLNGKWEHVLGNHDRKKILEKAFIGTNHSILGDYHETKYKDSFLIMMHYPIESWNKKHYGSFHFFGHLHQMKHFHNLSPLKNRFLVSLDSHPQFIPYKLDDLIENEPD